jgi:hypothetical protein
LSFADTGVYSAPARRHNQSHFGYSHEHAPDSSNAHRRRVDGWRAIGGDLAKPLPMPLSDVAVPHGLALSDNFSNGRLGSQWAFYKPGPGETRRVRFDDSTLVLGAKGRSPADSSPLTLITGDQAYRLEVEIEIDERTQAGLLLFYSDRYMPVSE